MFLNLKAACGHFQYKYHVSVVFFFAVRSSDGPEEEKDGFIFLLQCLSALGLLQHFPSLQYQDRPISVSQAQSIGIVPHYVILDIYLFSIVFVYPAGL